MSKGSRPRSNSRVSAVDPEDGDRYHAVDKSPSRTLNSFGVIKMYPSNKYKENAGKIFGQHCFGCNKRVKRDDSDNCPECGREFA